MKIETSKKTVITTSSGALALLLLLILSSNYLVHANDVTDVDPEHLEAGESYEIEKKPGMIPTNSKRMAIRMGKSLTDSRYRLDVDFFKPLAVGEKPQKGHDHIFDIETEYATSNFSWDPGIRGMMTLDPKGGFDGIKSWEIRRREVEASILTAYRMRFAEKKGFNASRKPKAADVQKVETDFTQKKVETESALNQNKAEITTYEKALTPELLQQFNDCQKQLSKEQCLKNTTFGVIAILEQKRAEAQVLQKKLAELPQLKADALKTLTDQSQSTFNRISGYSFGTLAVLHEADADLKTETLVAANVQAIKIGYHKAILFGGVVNVDYCAVLAPAGMIAGLHKNGVDVNRTGAVFYQLSAEACAGIRVGNAFEVRDRLIFELRRRLDVGDVETFQSVSNQVSVGNVFNLPFEVGYRTEFRAQETGNSAIDQISHFITFGLTN